MKILKKIFLPVFILVGALFLTNCQPGSPEAKNKPLYAGQQYAVAANGMVATSHPLATAVGVKVLEDGGNAADAAIAVSFTLAVVEPAMSGLGGRMQAIIRTPDGELHGIDATTQAPMTYDPETAPQGKYGYPVIGVPGLVAGLAKLRNDFGTLPLNKLMAPAIHYAEEGFYQSPDQVELQRKVRGMVLEFAGTRQVFIQPNDTLFYGPDDLLVQKDLAHTLKLIARDGADAFYKGEIAEKMVADIQAHGGAVTMESLAAYRAETARVLHGTYRGYDVYGLWVPSFGAVTIEILQIMANLPMPDYTEAEWASAIYQATKIAYEDRFKQISYSDGKPLPKVGEHLIDPAYAKEQASRIRVGPPVEAAIQPHFMEQYMAYSAKQGHTTHFSIVDKNGMVVSLTQSIGPIMGSRVVTPGLGFLYAATLGGYLGPMQPGQRAASHISPMILTANGEPFMGIGAAGGTKINSSIVQVISRVVDRKMNLAEALAAPRVHPDRDGTLLIEVVDSLSWSQDDYNFLRDHGFMLEKDNEPFKFGRVHVIMRKGNSWQGAADPDGDGTAAGPVK